MRVLERWRQLEGQERALLLEAIFALARARLALRLRPFSATWRELGDRTPRAPHGANAALVDPALVAQAVRRASKVIPESTCLPQAMATHAMLARRGIAAEVRIGVAKDAQRAFEAHAWVELHGVVLIGDLHDLHRYELLPRPQEEGRLSRRCTAANGTRATRM